MLRSLAEGLRVVTVLLHAYMPETTERLMGALGQDGGFAIEAARFGAAGGGTVTQLDPPLFPKQPLGRSMARDRLSHTHLDRPAPGNRDAELRRRRPARPGVRRILTVGTDSASCRAAIAAAEAHEEVYAAVGRHPNDSTGYEDAVTDELRELARHPKVLAIGETGLDDYRDYAPRADQERAFSAHMALARETGKPLVIHTRAAEDDTIAMLDREAAGLEVILHCFSMPDRLDACLERGWWISFAGNVTYPKAQELAEAAGRVPLDRLLVETDAPYLTPQAERKHRNQPAFVVHTARFVAERRGIAYEELEAAVDANAARLLRLVSELPAQPSLRRMKAFGIRPNRELGQNFLIDSNLLDVISRAAEVGPDDVVLEVGGGLGVLSEHLAERARHVHVVELDRRLEAALRDATDPHPERQPPPRRRGQARPRRARPRAGQGRREPALRRRRDGDPAHDRDAAGRDDLGGDGAEGGRGALRRRAPARPPTGSRRCSRSSRAT